MRFKSALPIPVTAALICVAAARAAAAPGWDAAQRPIPSVATIPCPLMNPTAIMSGRDNADGGKLVAQRVMGGLGDVHSGADAPMRGRSRGKAILLTAVAPGAGHVYSGYNRGYLYLGMEAVAWISYFVLRENGNGRAERAESFAGDPNDPRSNWSFDRYGEAGFCNAPQGSAADSTLRSAWTSDRPTFFDLIESDSKYGCGWDDLEAWGEFRNMRSNSEDLLRWAKYAGAAVVLNRAIAVIDMVRLTRGFDLPGGAEVTFKVDPSPRRPSGSIRIKKVF